MGCDLRRATSHADDVAHIISSLQPDGGRAFVCGVSIGAIIGLEVMRRHPARVARLIAEEPPVLGLLPTARRDELRAKHAEVDRLFLERGIEVALQAGAALGELDFNDREPDVVLGGLPPDIEHNLRFFLDNEGREMREYAPKVDELAAHSDRIVIAVGASNPERWIRVIAQSLAARLRSQLAELPGGHTGYVLRPRAFAASLVELCR